MGYISVTTYENQKLGINNMLSSLKRRKVNTLLNKSYVSINLIWISFSWPRTIVKTACNKKY